MVCGTTQYWYSWTGKLEDARRDFRDSVSKHGFEPDALLEPATWLTVFLRAGGAAAPCICSTLIRREVAMSIGGGEEKFRGQYEDQVLFVKVGLQAPVFVASECWSRYRQHPDSSWIVTQKTGEQHSVRLYFLNWLAEYLSKQGVKDTEVWKLLQEAQLQVHSKELKTLERALEKERREVRRLTSEQPKTLERALEKERREARRLRQRNRWLKERNRRLRLRIQDMNRETQNGLNYRIRKMSKRLGALRARLLGR